MSTLYILHFENTNNDKEAVVILDDSLEEEMREEGGPDIYANPGFKYAHTIEVDVITGEDNMLPLCDWLEKQR